MDVNALRDALRRAVEPRESGLVRAWRSWEQGVPGANERFTEFWKGKDGVYRDLATLLGLKCVREGYQRVHATYLSPEGTLLVALEHENNIKTAAHEIQKLASLDAPFNVVVTYPVTQRPDEERDRYLREFERILAGAKPKGKHMVVVGILRGSQIDWTFYVFCGLAFVEL